MSARNCALFMSAWAVVLFAGPWVAHAQTEADAAGVISGLENDAVTADLAGDPAFYRRVLAEDWTRGDSDGSWYTKAEVLKLMSDGASFKTSREALSDLRVRVYGDTAVATYRDTYDVLFKGQHRAHSIIATDTFARIGGEWKQVASHGAEAH